MMKEAGRRYFLDRVKAATELLDLSERRFDLGDDRDPRRIYYWLLDIRRLAKCIGMRFYSRRGRRTLIGLLHNDLMWLRSKIYTASCLTEDDLLDSKGHLKPQCVDDRTIDFERLLADIARETKVLHDLLQEYSTKEAQLIEDFRQLAKQRIGELY